MSQKAGNKAKYPFSLISRYRNELFGISIISIIIFHYFETFDTAVSDGLVAMDAYGPLGHISTFSLRFIGSVGVDVFLFLSGMGLYYSFSESEDPGSFYRKRYSRILVPYLICGTLFWVAKDILILKQPLSVFLEDISFYSMISRGVVTIWFIGLMIVLYAVFPLIHKLLYKEKHGFTAFIILEVIAVLFPVLVYFTNEELFDNIQIAITRIPVFIAGAYAGGIIKKRIRVNLSFAILIMILAELVNIHVVSSDYMPLINRYADSFHAIGIILFLTLILSMTGKLHGINGFLSICGSYSLELYITHVTIRNLMSTLELKPYDPVRYLVMVMLSIAASFILKRITASINKALKLS